MSRKNRKILFIFGTRPEAIKMAPLMLALRDTPGFVPRLCVTAQHRGMLDQVLRIFNLKPHHDLNIMRPGQSLFDITASAMRALEEVLKRERPDLVVVQGDTTTTFTASLAAFYSSVPVAHVEAGLRTGDKFNPYPEEMNRLLTSRIADLHFAPTKTAAEALRAEGAPRGSVHVTGNTVVDALGIIRKRVETPSRAKKLARTFPFLKEFDNVVLVTAHRRESFGEGMQNICGAIRKLALKNPYAAFVYPVHLNPNIAKPVRKALGVINNVKLIEPLDYESFVYLMLRSRFIMTDSGGVQEEAPSLGVPVLVMREVTERMEAVDAGVARIVGTRESRIVTEATRLLSDDTSIRKMRRARNPFGDGRASERIIKVLKKYFQ